MEQKQDIRQTITQRQMQQISMQQVALAGLIELPIGELAERVRSEVLDNAALEEDDHTADIPDPAASSPDATGDDGSRDDDWTADPAGDSLRDCMGDYGTEDDVPAYLQQRADDARERREAVMTEGTSAYEDLMAQMGELSLSDHERAVTEYVIGSLDDDGYLRKDTETIADELAVYHNVDTTGEEVERALEKIQRFDPPGIGARSLQECMLLQLRALSPSPLRTTAISVVEKNFDAFSRGRWAAICTARGITGEEAERVKRYIVSHVNPRPGHSLGTATADTAPTVTPDFYVRLRRDGEPEVELNDADVPPLRVSRAFSESLRRYAAGRGSLSRSEQEAYVYARQKVESAQTFLNLLRRRRQTLVAVMESIVALQRDFFTDADEESLLRPLTLKEVALRAGLDISTVSRVTGSKYVQTDYGIYPLKFFFSSQFTTGDGDEMSSRRVRAALREIVDAEDRRHPLSDEALAAALAARGMKVARRTVAKYREKMGILSTRLRRSDV